VLSLVNPEALERCRETIAAELGSIDDLPYELSNTIANVYYLHIRTLVEGQRPGSLPAQVKEFGDLNMGMERFIEDTVWASNMRDAIPEMVGALREVDRLTQPNLYAALVDYLLDLLKYRIRDADKNTGVRRVIERWFRKKRVREIGGLVDMLC